MKLRSFPTIMVVCAATCGLLLVFLAWDSWRAATKEIPSRPPEDAGGHADPDLAISMDAELKQLIERYLTCTDLDCEAARRAIVQRGNVSVTPLIAAMSDREAPGDQGARLRVRRLRVLSILGEFDDERAVTLLLEALHEDDPLQRSEAAIGLGKCGDVRVLPSLLPILADPDPLVRESTVHAIERLDPKAAAAALRAAAEREAAPHVRQAIDRVLEALERRSR